MAPRVTPLINSVIGLNTRLDPERMQQGSRQNGYAVEVAQAVNVSIDERGLVSLRNGYNDVQAGVFHSLFCDGGDCLVAQDRTSDEAIYQVNLGYTLAGLRSSMTKGARIEWGRSGEDTFYSNGVEHGYVRSGVSYDWPDNPYRGPDADMQFEATAPIANHFCFLSGGQIILSVGAAVYSNHAPFQYGLFNLRAGYIGFQSPVTMLAAVRDGFFASDTSRTWFFRRTKTWYAFQQELVEDASAIEWSLAHDRVSLQDVLNPEATGFGRVWASSNGVCLGTDEGRLINITKEKVVYPSSYNAGACLVKDTTVINTIY